MKRALLRAAAAGAAAVLAVSVAALPASAADTWRKVDLPFLWPNASIADIAAAAPGDVWIAGVQGSFCIQPVPMWPCVISSSGNPVVRQWDGSRWREYPIDGWTGTGSMRQVAAGGGETWVAGGIGGTYVGRLNGRAFEPASVPGGIEALTELAGGPAGVWAVTLGDDGTSSLPRRAGGAWTRTPVPADLDHISDVQARTPTDAWAVGETEPAEDAPGLEESPAIAHWDGSTWTSVPAHTESARDAGLLAVAPAGVGEVWAISRKALLYWDGASWTTIPGPSGVYQMRDLAADDAGNPWAIVETTSFGYTLFRYIDGAWQQHDLSPTGRVDEIASVPGTGALWATGGDARTPFAWTNP
ncbi:hypothetical protein E1281_20250 [Actinomadura sp. KC345]|uniref:hypothetical protein n=1 Tax=Actinomadura sp. KC345 TaxID=2530371 RepID=UPI0010494C7B|nr:hypothetical protein [Actinomadura sp. KC345]TDC51558.1 hypothetical protein E1281_20250 [Actinomadura sp. KC345]